MKIYSQKDPNWKNKRLGTCSTTFGASGCFVCSLSTFAGDKPTIVNERLTKYGGYANGCLVISTKSAKLLGLEYNGKVYKKPNHDCIAETNNYAPKVPQHFFILLKDGMILDPLDYPVKPKKNPYKIISYRLFKPKELIHNEKPMKEHKVKEILKASKKYLGIDAGERINSEEDRKIAKSIKELHEESQDCKPLGEEEKILSEIEQLQRDKAVLEGKLLGQSSKIQSIKDYIKKLFI